MPVPDPGYMQEEFALMEEEQKVRVFGPASLSNLGPGFDTLGLCLDGVGDMVEAWKKASAGVEIILGNSRHGSSIPLDPKKNTAGVAAASVLRLFEADHGVTIKIDKGFKPGSGIGSSAACAVAAAWAVNLLMEKPAGKDALLEAVLAGEAVASGARHGDNVLPALLGGLVLVSSDEPTRYRCVAVPENLWISLILPEIQVLTKEARAMLPVEVPMQTAVNQASSLAFMIDAFRAGDWQTVGACIMEDRLAEPVRATLVPCYNLIKNAALDAGAFGCALTGSGPAMFALSDTKQSARVILNAMLAAARQDSVEATGYLSIINKEGATVRTDSSAKTSN